MKIIVALDSFKGTFRSLEACNRVKAGMLSVLPGLDVRVLPMADGGEGTAEVMLYHKAGKWISQTVTGPLPEMQVQAGYAWFDDHTALIEMASASGIELLSHEQLNPMAATTYGTGELIKAAIEKGAQKIYLAVGGSATVDGGVGAAMAMGWGFLNQDGLSIELGAGPIGSIQKIMKPANDIKIPVEVLCDVTNPLCGPNGAARMYAPQKGASSQQVEWLESNLVHLAGRIEKQFRISLKDIPAGGAAGGLAAGAIAFLNATLVSGIDTILDISGFLEESRDADWIVTGEGAFDEQSLNGKVVSGILKRAAASGAKVAVLAGQSLMSEHRCREHGIHLVAVCRDGLMSLDDALANAEMLLESAAKDMARQMIAFKPF